MRLGQIQWNQAMTAAIFDSEGCARPIPDYNFYELLVQSEKEGTPLSALGAWSCVRRNTLNQSLQCRHG